MYLYFIFSNAMIMPFISQTDQILIHMTTMQIGCMHGQCAVLMTLCFDLINI